MQAPLRAYVAGRWTDTPSVREVRSPFDGRLVGAVHECGPAEVEAAIAAAAASALTARRLPTHVRASVCRQVAVGLRARADEIAVGLVLEGGKPIADARAEVDRAVHCFEIAAAETERASGEVLPLDLRPGADGRLALTRRVAVGPMTELRLLVINREHHERTPGARR